MTLQLFKSTVKLQSGMRGKGRRYSTLTFFTIFIFKVGEEQDRSMAEVSTVC